MSQTAPVDSNAPVAEPSGLAGTVAADGKSVQDYIDELPRWADGTLLKSAPMTVMQWRIWSLAAAGKFFEGFVVFMTGVALPLMAREFHLRTVEKGIISAASLAGILVGAALLGGLSDYFGRKRMFIAEMIVFVAFLAVLILCRDFISVSICLFGLGLALGCDYPTAHMIISENIPSLHRGKFVLAAFGFQALGALAGTGVGCVVLILHPMLDAWRWMYGVALIPALVVTFGRFFVVESANWLAVHGNHDEAEQSVSRLLARNPPYPKSVRLRRGATIAPAEKQERRSILALLDRRCRRATIFASVPWFLQDLSTYGIGIFTPVILAATVGAKSDHIRSFSDVISDNIIAAEGAALIDVLLIVGIVFAVLLADTVGRIKLQIIGFIGCAAGLFLATLSADVTGPAKLALIVSGFMLFNFMTNLGPNAQTYLIAGEVFPTKMRGTGAGFAASFGKVGAVATAFLFPILLSSIGTSALLWGLVVASLLGAVVTWKYRIETTGLSLDQVGR